MKKILLAILGISVLIISMSVAYYFVIFLPQREKIRIEQENLKFDQERQEREAKKEQDELEALEEAARDDIKTIKEIAKEKQKLERENWNRARAECISIANRNLDSFDKLLQSCQTDLCIDNVIANKELQNFGNGFIESCTENRL